jgi:hypothetical protein
MRVPPFKYNLLIIIIKKIYLYFRVLNYFLSMLVKVKKVLEKYFKGKLSKQFLKYVLLYGFLSYDNVDRAQNAKPCIIFFDEFESIAPKSVLLIKIF